MNAINFYLRSESKDKTSGYVYVKFYVNREKVNFTTGVQCLTKHWNEQKMRVSAADKEAADKNLMIENILARITNVFVKYKLKDRKITREGFYKMYHRPDDYATFFEFCTTYQKSISKFTELPTLANHNKAINKLRNYRPELHFDDITHDFLEGYFKGELLKTHENMHSTAYKDMTVIRKYVHAARRAGYIDNNPFADFKIKRVEGNYTYLTKAELQRLIKVYKTGKLEPEIYKTLQLFIYMCFSSQHITDALNTRVEDFGTETFGYVRKKLKNVKPVLVTVSISDSLRTILTDIVGHRKQGLIFSDMPAEQTMNRYLKKIAERDDVKILKNITHKTARHTFATIYLSETKDIFTLKGEMGHSDIRETMKYAHILSSDKKKNIHCFDGFMDDPDTTEQSENLPSEPK